MQLPIATMQQVLGLCAHQSFQQWPLLETTLMVGFLGEGPSHCWSLDAEMGSQALCHDSAVDAASETTPI